MGSNLCNALLHDATEFSSRSPDYANLIRLFECWTSASMQIMSRITPDNISYAALQYLISKTPRILTPDPLEEGLEDVDEVEAEEEREGEVEDLEEMHEDMILDMAMSIKPRRKAGRHRKGLGAVDEEGEAVEGNDH